MSTTPLDASTTLSTPGTQLAPASGSTATNGTAGLGENDFLMLMMDQLRNQDPLNPSDPTQFMSELAQFTSLEQQTGISTSTAAAAAQQTSASALSLLGRTVTYTGADGTTHTGSVSKVHFGSSGPTLTIGTDTGIALSDVAEAS